MKKSIILSLLILLTTITFSQEKIDSEKEKLANSIAKESKYYGLIIGINHYPEDALPNLDNPIPDAEKLYLTLTSSYNFEDENIMLLKDATRADIIKSLDQLTGVVTPDDNVLIFYAGHGTWDMNANINYWLPSDANKDTKVNWFPDSRLLDYLKTINSKHTLLIMDASFSGSIFKTRSAMPTSNPDLPVLYEHPSRKAITSCSLTEASDNGIFTRYLVQGLNENHESCLSSEQLFSSFRMDVITNGEAIPQYGEISETGDEGGDFIFIKSK
jgi:hypothetical protein